MTMFQEAMLVDVEAPTALAEVEEVEARTSGPPPGRGRGCRVPDCLFQRASRQKFCAEVHNKARQCIAYEAEHGEGGSKLRKRKWFLK